MRCTFKTVFYVNGSKERNGIVPIMGRVTINGTIAQFSCKQSVTKAIWDAKGNRAIGKSKEAKEVNFALDNIKAQIAKHYQRLSDREAFVTAEMVRNAYQGIGTEYETLLRAFDKENAAFAKRVGKDRAKNTYNKYLVVRKYVAEFIKYQYKRSDMSMNELTEEFIRDYCLYLKNIGRTCAVLHLDLLHTSETYCHSSTLQWQDTEKPFCHGTMLTQTTRNVSSDLGRAYRHD